MPPAVRQMAREWYYPRKIARYSAADWLPADGVHRLVSAGSVVVDAGANVGYITATLARWVGPEGRVHSFEPVPSTFAVLRRTVEHLRLGNVILHPCALSDSAGEAKVHIPSFADGRENFYEASLHVHPWNTYSGRSFSVRTATLDDELGSDAERVHFMKIDVEGHEEPLLLGSRLVLQRARPALLIEIDGSLDDESVSAGRVARFLESFGYRPYFWRNDWCPRQRGESAVDYFFLMPHHVSA